MNSKKSTNSENIPAKNIFDFSSYREFLIFCSTLHPLFSKRGFLRDLGIAAQCQAPYISQVMHGRNNFSLEQGEAIGRYLAMSHDEIHYFLLLIQKERAGTENLNKYFQAQIQLIKDARLHLQKRLKLNSKISHEFRAHYYSSWYYAAIHMALTIPRFRTVQALSQKLLLDPSLVREILDEFLQEGLIAERVGTFELEQKAFHLERESIYIRQHHREWRVKALRSLDQPIDQDFHYSAVVTLSQQDKDKIKSILAGAAEAAVRVIKSSPEEILCAVTLDFFEL